VSSAYDAACPPVWPSLAEAAAILGVDAAAVRPILPVAPARDRAGVVRLPPAIVVRLAADLRARPISRVAALLVERADASGPDVAAAVVAEADAAAASTSPRRGMASGELLELVRRNFPSAVCDAIRTLLAADEAVGA